jgi:hypothetical protein
MMDYRDILKGGLLGLTTDTLGAPVDLAAMLMRPMGYNVENPVMGSDWLANKLSSQPTTGAGQAARVAGGLLSPDPMDAVKLAGLLGAGIVKQIGDQYGVIGKTYDYRDKIKALGGKWDSNHKSWNFNDLEKARMADKTWGGSGLLDTEKSVQIAALDAASPRKYLNVPYAEKDAAKRLGAMWDAEQKKWFVRGDVPEGLAKYANQIPKSQTASQTTGLGGQYSIDDLRKKADYYRRTMLEGGDGYNPWEAKLEDALANEAAKDPKHWEYVAANLRRQANDALYYSADGWLDEAARRKNHDALIAKADEAMEKANSLRR